MKIYGLSGKSGTGKSYNAIELCSKRDIPALIDDGLYIYENAISAGMSAKKQPTKVGAIKTALFTDESHCLQVQAAISQTKPKAILILGTSDRMVDKIATRLGLPAIEEYIHIEDVTSEKQREKARLHRDKDGMHTIPAPTFEVKKQFSGFFLDARKSFINRVPTEAKTIVRPTYSYLGSYTISDTVISDITQYVVDNTEGIANLLWATCANSDEGMYIRIIILCKFGAKLKTTALELQKNVYEAVSNMTAFNILGIEVEVRGYR